jgi:murein DD-endopeptidase MepM/ murein hydrolase activator NlpD
MATLIKTNNLASPYNLKIGQRIIIPRHGIAAAPTTVAAPATVPARPAQVAAAAPAYGGFHVAGPGDTLYKIAQRYRVSVADLAKANRITTRAQVKLGDRLAIPAQHSVRPAPAPAAAVAAPKLAPPQPQAATAPAVVARPQHAALASPTETPEEAKSGGAVFRWPVRGRIITAFGAKPNGQQNDGINIAVPEGTPVKAAEDGEVAYAGNELKGYGNLILVRHPNGFVTAYAHASELLVKRGDKVKRGQVIAKSGRTGNIASPQLHFEIRKGSTPVDPAPYLGA